MQLAPAEDGPVSKGIICPSQNGVLSPLLKKDTTRTKRQVVGQRGRKGKENLSGTMNLFGQKRKAKKPPRCTVSLNLNERYAVIVCDPAKRTKLPLSDCSNMRKAEAVHQPRLGQ